MIILTTVTLASSNNALPDDGDCTEICRSCFNVNFNVNFKIVFKTIHLCISWWIKNFDNANMHGMYVEKRENTHITFALAVISLMWLISKRLWTQQARCCRPSAWRSRRKTETRRLVKRTRMNVLNFDREGGKNVYKNCDIFVTLQLVCQPVAVVQYAFTHKQYTEWQKTK
jgi:hypothetical protein